MIYFASDVHLGAGAPAREPAATIERRFCAWLDSLTDAEAVFILGDLFDFWFEYHRVVPKESVRVFGRLAALADRGVRVVLITGNHDMWTLDYLTSCGIEVYNRALCETLYGRTVFMAHGDNLPTERKGVMLRLINGIFRSSALRWAFQRWLHPDLALRFGQAWSRASRRKHRALKERSVEPLIRYARSLQPRPDYCLFGHMHVAHDYRDAQVRVVCLGEWEHRPAYAVLSPDGELTLKFFES